MAKNEESTTIVRVILGLANGFGLATTAEGVEDAGQLAALKADGCQEGQGYLFAEQSLRTRLPALLKSKPKAVA